MLLSYAQDAGAHGHTLEDLSRLHLGHGVTALDSVTGTGRARLPLSQVPVERAASPCRGGGGLRAAPAPALRARLADARPRRCTSSWSAA